MTTGPADPVALAAEFEAHRPRLMRLAYATTGSLAEAEDCVQEGWLRLQRAAEREPVRDLGAWLTTTVSRLALDALDRARVRREHHAGPWLPEPLIESLADPGDSAARPGADPADRVTLDESVSMALLIVLEALTPAERTVFLLHDVFGVSYEEITGVVVREDRPRFPPTRAQQREVLDAFLRACTEGDLGRLVTLLDPEVVWRADGGVVRAKPKQARGAAQIAALLVAFARRPPQQLRTALVNGAPGLVVRDADGILSVMILTLDDGRITAIDVIRNPDKLTGAAELLKAGE